MHKTYVTSGVCSRQIDIDIDDNNVITACRYTGGCNGNTQGVARLVEGMEVDIAIAKLEGITCGFKNTSCPDQLAKALSQFMEQE